MYALLGFWFCVGLFVQICHNEAGSLDDLKQDYVKIIMECVQSYPITGEDLEQLKKRQLPNKDTVKCLFACAYKKTGMMNDQGMLSVDGTNAIVQKYFSDNPDEIQKGMAYTEACKSVNEASVSDGNKGCERAALLFDCTVKNMPALGPGL